jgi:hypothetical protein
MTALLVFTESQPLLVMVSRAAVSDGRLEESLNNRGIKKFIAHEVPLEYLRNEYGRAFELIEADIRNGEDIRVLDSRGSHIFSKVRFADLGHGMQRDLPKGSAFAEQHCETPR